MFVNINYKEDYPEYTEAYEKFMDIIKNTNCHNIAEENNFVSTGQALFYLSFQINRICDSILLRFIDDYAIVILYRSVIEHSMKHFYIFLRFHKENNDNVGKQYYFDCIYNELVKKMNVVLWPNYLQVKQDKKQKHKQLKKKADQFTFREMSNFIGEIILSNMSEPNKELIQRMKMEYNLSSSYTHGGPEAISMETQIPKEYIQHSSVSFSILSQLHTIRTFSNFNSPNKKRLMEVGQRMEELLDISFKNLASCSKGIKCRL